MAMTDSEHHINLVALAKNPDLLENLRSSMGEFDQLSATIKQNTSKVATVELLNGAKSDILLLDIDLEQDRALPELERIVGKYGAHTPIIVTSPVCPSNQVRQLFHLGVTDYLPQPVNDDDLKTAITRALDKFEATAADPQDRRGEIITFMHSCGGIGSTSILVEMAHAVYQMHNSEGQHPEVGLLDLDIQFGNIATSLDLSPKSSLESLLDAPERLDKNFLRSAMLTHESGLHVLSSPEDFLPLEAMTSDLIEPLLETATSCFDLTFIDMPHTWTDWTYEVLAKSSQIYLVMNPNVTSVRRTHRILNAISELGLKSIPLSIIANKCETGVDDKNRLKEVTSALGRSIDFTIRNDSKVADEARNRGVFLSDISERSAMLKDTQMIASDFSDSRDLEPNNERPAVASFLSRFSSTSKAKTKWR